MQTRLTQMAQEEPDLSWSNNSEYGAFRRRLWDVNHGEENPPLPSSSSERTAEDEEEEDLVVAATRQTLICPLTQRVFDKPVFNPTCGHTYSRDAILGMARSATTVPCPLHGCNATVSIPRLQPNEEMTRRIIRRSQPKIF